MRLFIAINFSDKTKSSILAIRDELQRSAASGRFSSADIIHLTLVFLGELDLPQSGAVKKVMGSISAAPFNIELYKTGFFKRTGGDTWWVGARESEPLMRLQRELDEKLRAAGFAIESRRYSPHITIGREVVVRAGSHNGSCGGGYGGDAAGSHSGSHSGDAAGGHSGGYSNRDNNATGGDAGYSGGHSDGFTATQVYRPAPFTPFGDTVTSIDLMKSERIGGKLVYTRIYQVKFNNGQT